jgi:hypothetical protein
VAAVFLEHMMTMMFLVLVLILSLPSHVQVLTLPKLPRKAASSQLFGYRQSYLYKLEQFTKTGKIEVNGELVDPAELHKMMDQDLQISQADQKEAEMRVSTIESQLQEKLKEHTKSLEEFKVLSR